MCVCVIVAESQGNVFFFFFFFVVFSLMNKIKKKVLIFSVGVCAGMDGTGMGLIVHHKALGK